MCRVETYVNWCGHGQEIIPLPLPDGRVTFVPVLGSRRVGPPCLLRTFATQSGLAIQNARLFHEIADKSRQLDAASRHKSELGRAEDCVAVELNAALCRAQIDPERFIGHVR